MLFFRTTEWIRAQISVYFSLSILQPPSSLTTTIHRSWLLCLAHRYFPSSVPDLIFRLKQHKDDDYDDVNFVYQLFVDHWNLTYTTKDCIFTFVDTIRQHVTQYNLTTPSNNILAGKYHNIMNKKKTMKRTHQKETVYIFL